MTRLGPPAAVTAVGIETCCDSVAADVVRELTERLRRSGHVPVVVRVPAQTPRGDGDTILGHAGAAIAEACRAATPTGPPRGHLVLVSVGLERWLPEPGSSAAERWGADSLLHALANPQTLVRLQADPSVGPTENTESAGRYTVPGARFEPSWAPETVADWMMRHLRQTEPLLSALPTLAC